MLASASQAREAPGRSAHHVRPCPARGAGHLHLHPRHPAHASAHPNGDSELDRSGAGDQRGGSEVTYGQRALPDVDRERSQSKRDRDRSTTPHRCHHRQDRRSTLAYRLPVRERSARRDGDTVRLTPSQLSQLTRSVGSYHALVIGNNNYRQIPRLQTAVNDAQEVAKVLKRTVRLPRDPPDRRYRLRSPESLGRPAPDTDQRRQSPHLLRGTRQDGRHERERVLAARDAEANNNANWISNGKVTSILDAMAARQVLLVADSCYSGTLDAFRDGPARARENAGRDASRAPAVDPEALAHRDDLRQARAGPGQRRGSDSVFAEAFLKALRDNDSVLLGQDFFRRVQIQVADAAAQLPLAPEPQYAPIHPGYEAGDFVLVRPAS